MAGKRVIDSINEAIEESRTLKALREVQNRDKQHMKEGAKFVKENDYTYILRRK